MKHVTMFREETVYFFLMEIEIYTRVRKVHRLVRDTMITFTLRLFYILWVKAKYARRRFVASVDRF